MYDVDAIRRKISKEGVEAIYDVIRYLSGEFDECIQAELTKAKLLVDGYPNMSLIMSLA